MVSQGITPGIDETFVTVSQEAAPSEVMSPGPSVHHALQKGRSLFAQSLQVLAHGVDSMGRFLTEHQRAVLMIVALLLAAIVLKVVLAMLNSLNEIPLMEPFLQLVGIGYSVWFFQRYVLFAATRQELAQEWQGFTQRVVGSRT